MDKLLYIAMTGARETSMAQAVSANNLANAKTTGFKSDLAQFRAMPVYGDGHASRVFAMSERPGHDLSSGGAITTGRSLDLAIRGDGWFVVQDEQGDQVLTRRGDLKVTASGALVNGADLPVLGDSGPIVLPPFESLDIGKDGTITIIPQGANANAQAVVDRIMLVNPAPESLEKNNQGLFVAKDDAGFEPDVTVTLEQGVLESSNVSVVAELTNMIALSRRFEVQVKLMASVEENGKALDRLLQS